VCDGEFDIQQRAEFVRFLLEQGSEVDALNYVGTPLSYAAHPETVKLLLDHGADMTLDGPNSGVLDMAADASTRGDAEHQEKWLEITKLLRAAGAECDIVSASILNDLARVRRLLISGRPAKIQDALRAAATWGRTEIVKVLLAAGADPNDGLNDKPVVYDAIRHPDVLRIFFDRGIDVGATYKRNGLTRWTLLHEAAIEGAVESGRLLFDRGIPVDSTDADGQTPLHVAAISGRFEFVRFLLDQHADLNAQANGGVTAISYAASEYRLWPGVTMEPSLADRREVIELLLAAGAPLDLFTAITLGRTEVARQLLAEKAELTSSRDCQRISPMNRAVDLNQAEIVEVLLTAGADIDGKGDYEGSTALHKAAFLGRHAIMQILIAHKADLNTTDAYGETPLHRAALRLNPQAVRLLLEAGANPNAKDPDGRTPLDVARAPRFGTETEAKQRERAEVIRLLSEVEESLER
jgi:cytohesin